MVCRIAKLMPRWLDHVKTRAFVFDGDNVRPWSGIRLAAVSGHCFHEVAARVAN
jgi:hypothetical protein